MWYKGSREEKKRGGKWFMQSSLLHYQQWNEKMRETKKQWEEEIYSVKKGSVLHYGRMVGGINRYEERNFAHMMSICIVSGGVKMKKRKQENRRVQVVLFCFGNKVMAWTFTYMSIPFCSLLLFFDVPFFLSHFIFKKDGW